MSASEFTTEPIEPALAPIRERIAMVRAARGALSIRGSGTKDFYGRPSDGETIDVLGHCGIVAYQPSELVITSRAGTRLSEIEDALTRHGQMLAFEPPRFGGDPTIGGVIAAGLSGPRRMQVGAVRDFVLGARMIDGQGRHLRFGGQVMKNVAGYDVSRLLAGSLGTLGVITEVSIKVLPKAVACATRRIEATESAALQRMGDWADRSYPVSGTFWSNGILSVRLEGARSAVRAAQEAIGGDVVPEDEATGFWDQVRNQDSGLFKTAQTLWRLAVPATAPVLAETPSAMIEWGGALRWVADMDFDRAASERVRAHGGHVTRYRAPEAVRRDEGVFTALSVQLEVLNRRVKKAFDPDGIFNRGRMYPDW